MSYINYNRSPYCSEPACQRALAQNVITQTSALVQAQTEQAIDGYFETQQTPKKQAKILAVLPANTETVIAAQAPRQQSFLQHLSRIYDDVVNHTPGLNKTYPSDDTPQDLPQVKGLLSKACATCKGYCCRLGAEHAFIDYASLRTTLQKLAQAPSQESQATSLIPDVDASIEDSMDKQQLISLYGDYLPSQSYSDSCVFQGPKGCSLPLTMRSITCRTYKCESLIGYEQRIKSDQTNLTYATAATGRKVTTIAIFSESQFTYVTEK